MDRIRPLLLGLVLLAACALPAPAAETVILLSLDGTTPAQLRDPELVTLPRLAREGRAAEGLVPVIPTNTFPNHVTFVTGVPPAQHGIVNNVFEDPERGRHSYENDPSWMQAEPLWSLVGRHGLVSAAYHWVGSEGPWTSGRGPRHWEEFDAGTPEREKVDRILAWLDLADPAERPRLVTTWFHGADGAGHRHGPGSPQVRDALRDQDRQLGRLVAGLEARGLGESTALVVVSDHGMTRVERGVQLRGVLERAGVRARVLGGGGFATIRTDDPAGAVAAARAEGLLAHARGEAPADWGVDHPRFGDVVVMAPPGTALVRGGLRGRVERLVVGGAGMAGAHGHHPDHPEMRGIFLAWGAVPPGPPLGAVRALDVAPTVLALLGLPVPPDMPGRPLLAPGVGAVPSAPHPRENPPR